MDLSIRDSFTKILNFIDFNNQKTENTTYRPA